MTPAPPKRLLLLANPNARSGSERLEEAVSRFKNQGAEVTVHSSESREAVSDDIIRMAGDYDAGVVCGGDGSLNAAARGFMESGLPMGLIPLGTANDLARTLNIPLVPGAAADVVLAGEVRKIDLGMVNDLPFFNVASIGLSVSLAETLNETDLKKRWGRLGYAIGALKVATRARPFSAEIDMDGSTQKLKSYQIAIRNGRHYGGGMVVEKDAAIDDEHLALYSLEMKSVWRLAGMLKSFRDGHHGAYNEVRTRGGSEFDIRTKKPRSVNADGELVTKTPAHFRIMPKAVTVFAPGRVQPMRRTGQRGKS